MKIINGKVFYSIGQLAREVGVDTSEIRGMCKRGEIKAYKQPSLTATGARYYIEPEEYDRVIKVFGVNQTVMLKEFPDEKSKTNYLRNPKYWALWAMDKEPDIAMLENSVYKLTLMATKSHSGEKPYVNKEEISWRQLEEVLIPIITESVALVLSGKLDDFSRPLGR